MRRISAVAVGIVLVATTLAAREASGSAFPVETARSWSGRGLLDSDLFVFTPPSTALTQITTSHNI